MGRDGDDLPASLRACLPRWKQGLEKSPSKATKRLKSNPDIGKHPWIC